MTSPARFERGRAMLMGGLRRVHRHEDAADGMGAQWNEFLAMLPLAGQAGSSVYGIMCRFSDTDLEYMTAVEVTGFDAAPQGIGRMRVPEQEYAVFEHAGGASSLRATWEGIWNDWVPRSGLKPADTPDFELYLDPGTPDERIEIWFPIERRPE